MTSTDYTSAKSTTAKDQAGPHIAIIGAGIGGLAMAIALKTQLGYHNFTLYEKASDIGGTWRDNIYPGAASDVPIHLYTLSSDLDPTFNYSHGTSPEITTYWHRLVTKYNLRPHIKFNAKITEASWNDEEQGYDITTIDPRLSELQGKEEKYKARVLISALGILEVPNFPDIEGIERFGGRLFHSARWEREVELRGKRVAVIGNGSSSAQFVPIISEDPSVNIVQFIRTPSWYKTAPWMTYSDRFKWILANVPGVHRMLRVYMFFRFELNWLGLRYHALNRLARKGFLQVLQENVPAKYMPNIVPPYSPGCKRIIYDRDTRYLKCLHRENVDLNFDGIERIDEGGILTRKGERIPFDVIITATGYATNVFPVAVKGTSGQTVEEYYDAHGGAQAYIGTTMPGFPNFFIVSGPNTVTGHNSVIASSEIQISYILKLLRPILGGEIASLDVSDEATERFNRGLEGWFRGSIFEGCVSWYRVRRDAPGGGGAKGRLGGGVKGKEGVEGTEGQGGGEGKVGMLFPGPLTLMWWWLRRVEWRDYRVVGVDGGKEGGERWRVREMGREVWRWWWRSVVAAVGMVVGVLLVCRMVGFGLGVL